MSESDPDLPGGSSHWLSPACSIEPPMSLTYSGEERVVLWHCPQDCKHGSLAWWASKMARVKGREECFPDPVHRHAVHQKMILTLVNRISKMSLSNSAGASETRNLELDWWLICKAVWANIKTYLKLKIITLSKNRSQCSHDIQDNIWMIPKNSNRTLGKTREIRITNEHWEICACILYANTLLIFFASVYVRTIGL